VGSPASDQESSILLLVPGSLFPPFVIEFEDGASHAHFLVIQSALLVQEQTCEGGRGHDLSPIVLRFFVVVPRICAVLGEEQGFGVVGAVVGLVSEGPHERHATLGLDAHHVALNLVLEFGAESACPTTGGHVVGVEFLHDPNDLVDFCHTFFEGVCLSLAVVCIAFIAHHPHQDCGVVFEVLHSLHVLVILESREHTHYHVYAIGVLLI
jgi:hypothetical protein